MDKKQQIATIKKFIIDKPKKVISSPEILIKILKELPLAAVFKQLIYWSDKGKNLDGWVYKTAKELADECCITKRQADRAMTKLVDLDLIESKVKQANGFPTRHYKVNHSVLIGLALQVDENAFTDDEKVIPEIIAKTPEKQGKLPETELQPSNGALLPTGNNVITHRSKGNDPQGISITDEYNKQIQHTKDKDQNTIVETTPQPIPDNTNLDFVFHYWRDRMGKNESTKFTKERKKLIKDRLVNYPVDDLRKAIDGCAQSEFHMGQEFEGQKKYNDLTLILRNDTKMEEFRDQFNPIQSGVKLNGTSKQSTKHDAPVDRCKAALAQQQAGRGFDGSVVGENVGGVGSQMGKVVRIDANRGVGGLPYRDDSGSF